VIEEDLIADIDAVIAGMSPAGRPPPVSWVEKELWRRHPMPPDLDERCRYGALAGLRLMIRRRLGLSEEAESELEPELASDELCAQAQRLMLTSRGAISENARRRAERPQVAARRAGNYVVLISENMDNASIAVQISDELVSFEGNGRWNRDTIAAM